MLVANFKAKQEYIDAHRALAVLLAVDAEESLTVSHLNKASAILAPFLSSDLHGCLVLR